MDLVIREGERGETEGVTVPSGFDGGLDRCAYATGFPAWLPSSMVAAAVVSATDTAVASAFPLLPRRAPTAEAYARQARRRPVGAARHAPRMLHWWMAQGWWLPASTVVDNTTHFPKKYDAEVRRALAAAGTLRRKREAATQQGIHESYYRDMAVMFGKWDFDPMDLPEPTCPMHLWQGDEDGLVTVVLQRHVAGKLGWVSYHELHGTGHFLSAVPGLGDTVLRTLFGSAGAKPCVAAANVNRVAST